MFIFKRLYSNPIGPIIMLFGVLIFIPIDMYFAKMTILESLITRAWMIVSKPSAIIYYEIIREKVFIKIKKTNITKLTIDGILYALFNIIIYSLPLITVRTDFISSTKAIIFIAITSIPAGQLFGMTLDKQQDIKSMLQSITTPK